MRILIRVMGKLIPLLDKRTSSDIERSSLHFVEQVWPHYLARSAYNLILAFVDDLGFVDFDAGLFFHAMFELILWFIVEGSWLTFAPLLNFKVLLEAPTSTKLALGVSARIVIIAVE